MRCGRSADAQLAIKQGKTLLYCDKNFVFGGLMLSMLSMCLYILYYTVILPLIYRLLTCLLYPPPALAYEPFNLQLLRVKRMWAMQPQTFQELVNSGKCV
jgi:hypothetical protein